MTVSRTIADALAAAFDDGGPVPPWDGETLLLNPRLTYGDCRTWDDYAEAARIGSANVRLLLARPDYRRTWVAAYEAAKQLPRSEPDPVDAVLEVTDADEQAAMFAVWVAQVPERYRRAALGDFEFEVVETVRGWIAGRVQRPGLVLAGPTGTGKTRLGYAIARQLFVDQQIVTWSVMSMPMLLAALRPGGEDDAFAGLATLDLLVLDDVGAERPTDWTIEQLDALVDLRWRHGLPTAVTTNMRGPEFRAHVGDRVHSRLVRDGVAIALTGADRRGDDTAVDEALVPDLVEHEPGKLCRRCRGLGVVDVPLSYVEREGHDAVLPCRLCRPEQYRAWGDGKFALRGGPPDRHVAHSTTNAPTEQAPLPLEPPSDVPEPPSTHDAIDVPLPYKD